MKFCRQRGLLHKMRLGSGGRRNVYYLSPYAARRVIASIRALQGGYYLAGRNHLEWREKDRLLLARKRAALKAASACLPEGRDRR